MLIIKTIIKILLLSLNYYCTIVINTLYYLYIAVLIAVWGMFFFGSLADHIHAYTQILHQITSGLKLNPHTFKMKGSSTENSSCSVDVECVNEVYLLCCVLQHDPGSHQRLTRLHKLPNHELAFP